MCRDHLLVFLPIVLSHLAVGLSSRGGGEITLVGGGNAMQTNGTDTPSLCITIEQDIVSTRYKASNDQRLGSVMRLARRWPSMAPAPHLSGCFDLALRLFTAVIAIALFSRTSEAHTGPGRLSLVQSPVVALDPHITLAVGPTLLFNSGEWVTVAWTGIEAWMFPDAFVAAFSPGDALDDPASITDVAPVKYQFITAGEPYAGDLAEEMDEVQGSADAVQSLRFRLLNLRDTEGYRFGLFTGGVEKPVLVAKTDEPVTFALPYEATNIHLALTGEADSMRISWTTGDASGAPAVLYRRVEIPQPDETQEVDAAPWKTVAGEAPLSYDAADMCGAPATTKGFHSPGLLQSAVLTDLSPRQPYEYKVGDRDAQEWSEAAFFYAPPAARDVWSRPLSDRLREIEADARANPSAFANAGEGPLSAEGDAEALASLMEWGPAAVKVGVFGDMGTAEVDGSLDAGHTNEPPSIRTVGILQKQLGAGSHPLGGKDGMESSRESVAPEPRLGMVLHIGDLSYARGYDAQWDEFLDQIEPVASVVPWMVGVGNHERDFPAGSQTRQDLSFYTGYDSGGDCGVPTAFRFLMPGEAGDPTADSPWYGFDFGPIHFTVISTEHAFTPDSKQYNFINEDLSGVDRSKTPWIVFAGHRPMYVNSGGPGAGDCEGASAEEEHCANDQPVSELMRSSLEPLLVKYQVDLAVYGHHHSYQRSCKVEGRVCKGMSSESPLKQDIGYVAPVHVVMGMAGMGLSQNMVSPKPEWVEYATDREYGLGLIVANETKLQLTFVLDSDGQAADQIVLVRPAQGRATDHDEDVGNASGEDMQTMLRTKNGRDRRMREISKKIGDGNLRRPKRVTS